MSDDKRIGRSYKNISGLLFCSWRFCGGWLWTDSPEYPKIRYLTDAFSSRLQFGYKTNVGLIVLKELIINIRLWGQEAKNLARAERELQIDRWIYIAFEYRNADRFRVVSHEIDIPQEDMFLAGRVTEDLSVWMLDYNTHRMHRAISASAERLCRLSSKTSILPKNITSKAFLCQIIPTVQNHLTVSAWGDRIICNLKQIMYIKFQT